MENNIGLDVLPKDPEILMAALAGGHMAAIRSKNDFLYAVDAGQEYLLFSHTVGSPDAGRKSFPKEEKSEAMLRHLTKLADAVFQVSFEDGMNLCGVMASAEDGILAMFPGESRDEDGDIEFVVPEDTTES